MTSWVINIPCLTIFMMIFFFKAAVVVKNTKILVFFFLCYSILANKSLFSQNMKSLILKDDVVAHVCSHRFSKA